LFGLVLVLVTAMAALLTAGVDDFWSPFATEVEQAGLPRNGLTRGGTLVVAMITLGALLLLARRAPGTRTALSTTAALFAAASMLNRAGITEVLERELAAGRDCGVLFVDLDNLKTINDELSHESGDRALRAVAQAIESRLRGRDRVGRIGGDEFMCVLTNLQDMAQFREVAGRVAQSIRDSRISGKGGSTGVKASIGGVIAPSHGDAQAALAAADECM